jgi:hypothetical protein
VRSWISEQSSGTSQEVEDVVYRNQHLAYSVRCKLTVWQLTNKQTNPRRSTMFHENLTDDTIAQST